MRDLLAHFPIVLAVARLRGFAAAAKALNMSPSAVGHAVRQVEERVGEPLFYRTTRSVALTEAGQRFVSTIGPSLSAIEESLDALRAARGAVTGLLRISASRVAALMCLTPVLRDLSGRHPALTVEVHANEAFVDIVADGFDAGIRLGEAVQQDMVAVRLTPPFQAILVASPAYLAAQGTPATIEDLHRHNCIGFRRLGARSLYAWDLQSKGKDVQVEVSGSVVVTDATYGRDLALAGVGIAYIFEPLVRADLARGDLRQVMAETTIEEDGLFLYCPRRAALQPKMRALIEAVRRHDGAAHAGEGTASR